MAEYWLNYGDALFTKEEFTEELFPTEGEDAVMGDGSKADAYESLDAARVCYQRRLDRHIKDNALDRFHEDDADVLQVIVGDVSESKCSWFPRICSTDPLVVADVTNSVFVRVRLGDFQQAFHEYKKAIGEFCEALKICRDFGLDYSHALGAAIPLAHCCLALDDESTEDCFKEVSSNPPDKRKQLLAETADDLDLQLKEYVTERERLVQELKKILMTGGVKENASSSSADSQSCTVDLGVVGGKRAKKETKPI